MKRTSIIFLFTLLLSYTASAQFGVSVHQSSLPFVGFNYQIGKRVLPEARLGIDNFLEDSGVELTLSYIFKDDETIQIYGGFGARFNIVQGVVVPVGMNIYPFSNKNFGFHIELAALSNSDNDIPVLRGSWGIRYRFKE